ncbi:hypothetical protein P8452_19875 [Trifolium repens]|nr:hypothetical protein P8452_19875 [Trifolium repens]
MEPTSSKPYLASGDLAERRHRRFKRDGRLALERRDAKPIRRTRKQWCRGITLRATTPLGYIEKTEVGYEGLKRRQRCTSLALETRKKD